MPDSEVPTDEPQEPSAPAAPQPPSQQTAPEALTHPVPPPGDPTGQVFVAEDVSSPEPDDEQHPSVLRTATVVSGRLILGVVVVAVLGVVVAAASLTPLPGVRARAISTVVTPVPTVQQLVCPGGLLRLGSASGASATRSSAIGEPQISSAATPGDVVPSAFATSDARTGGTAAAPRLLTSPPVAAGSASALLGGAQSETIATDEVGGLSSAACTSAAGGEWLSGGATSIGRTTLLLLANPTAVASTVRVQVFGETGQISAPGMDGIVVAPGAQRVLSIAGFAPNVISPVVHVTSTGGQIVANLEQSTVRGIVPGGVDFIGAQLQPAETAVIPGVVVSGTNVIQGIIGQSGFEDLQSTLRLFLPGTRSATVTITILSEDGTVTGKPTRAQMVAGTVNDLVLDSLSDGDYTILVSARVPVVASVRVSTASAAGSGAATDFAWATTAPLLTGDTVVSVAEGMSPTVHLYNPTAKPETVQLRALAGTSLTATVKPHAAALVPVTPGASYRLSGFSGLYASVSGVTTGGVTSYVVYPSARGAGPIRVFG